MLTAAAHPATPTGRGVPAPHVLVVGTGQGYPARILAADDRAAVTVLCREGTQSRVAEPGRLRGVVGVPADAPVEDWIARAAAVHADRPLTRVAAFGELDQDRAAAIGAALGVPATDPLTVARVHDKEAMRARLRETGVDPTPSARVSGVAELVDFLRRHGGRCVVKPVQGAGSAGVAVVDRPEDADAAWALASTPFDGLEPAGVLVERFHVGPQLSVEAFSEGGRHQVVAVVAKSSDPATTVELGHVTPADLPPADTAACTGFVEAVLDAVGITDGPSHTEVVLTADGPRVIETHVRLAGDEIPELVRRTTGVDLAGCAARQAAGQRVLPEIRQALAAGGAGGHAAIWFALPPVGGRLVEVRGLAAADAVALLDPGDDIAVPLNSDSRFAYALATAPTAAAALAAARARAERLTAVVEVAPLRPTTLL